MTQNNNTHQNANSNQNHHRDPVTPQDLQAVNNVPQEEQGGSMLWGVVKTAACIGAGVGIGYMIWGRGGSSSDM